MRHAGAIAIAAAVLTAPPMISLAQNAPPAGPRTSRLEGTASLDRHRKLVGASVLARAGEERAPFWLTSTDEKGLFVFDRLPEGTYRVEVKRDGLLPVVKEGVVVRFPYRAVVEVKLAPATAGNAEARPATPLGEKRVRLSGIVAVRGAGPLAEARVRISRTDASTDPRSTLTLPDGRFSFESVPAGAWRIEVLGAGYLPARTDLDLADDSSVEAMLVAQPTNYVAPALDLLPREQPIPPPGWGKQP